MPTLFIKDLVIEAKHGIHQHEKEKAQRFKVSVELKVDNDAAFVTDDLDDTLNWSQLRKDIIATVENNTFNLMERLAKEIADNILIDKRVLEIIVEIYKLDAFKTGIPGIRYTDSN